MRDPTKPPDFDVSWIDTCAAGTREQRIEAVNRLVTAMLTSDTREKMAANKPGDIVTVSVALGGDPRVIVSVWAGTDIGTGREIVCGPDEEYRLR